MLHTSRAWSNILGAAVQEILLFMLKVLPEELHGDLHILVNKSITRVEETIMKNRTNEILVALVVVVILGGALAGWLLIGPGKNKSTPISSNSSSNSQSATKQQIQQNWEKFFNGSIAAQDKIDILQNGSEFASVLEAEAQSSLAKTSTASVSNIVLNSANGATVTYTIDLSGHPALLNQTGHAVLVNNVWQISDSAFCQLLNLEGGAPPMCQSPSSATSQ